MQLLDPNDYHTAPWRNGGGVTHEIVRRDGPDGLIWRLSMAEVTTDGPFSFFNNLTRVLTVIDGAGLELISPDGEIMALPYQPVQFSGDLTISSQRIDGAVRDLNLIFDPAKINGSVTLLTGPGQNIMTPAKGREFALYCLQGCLGFGSGAKLPKGATALFTTPPATVDWSPEAKALLVIIDNLGAVRRIRTGLSLPQKS